MLMPPVDATKWNTPPTPEDRAAGERKFGKGITGSFEGFISFD